MSTRQMQAAQYLLTLILSLAATSVLADDWLHWRGQQRDATTQESSGWDGEHWLAPEPVWRASVGEGGTSPIVVNSRVYVMGWQDEQDRVVCLDARSGQQLWTQQYAAPKYGRLALGDQGLYSGPTSTPEFDVDTGLLYTLGCDGDLNCWDTAQQGEPVWNRNLHEGFSVQQRPRVGRSGHRDYGFTTSPLVQGDWVIVEVGATEGTIIAFDKQTGERRWTSQVNDPAGHTGGLAPLIVEGVPCLAVMTVEGLLVVRTDGDKAGQTVVQHPWKTDFTNNVAGVATSGNSVVITSAYNQNRIARLDVSIGSAALVWEQRQASKICTPIIQGGNVYWCWSQMTCLNFEDGTLKWQGGSYGDAGSCLFTSDKRLVTFSNQGDLRLIESAERSPDEFIQLAEIPQLFKTDVWPHIVLADGLYVCKDRLGNLVALRKTH